ncbi:DUF2309 domain-containing protein [Novosphingobium ginsenosidimutans]|uniref:DUF2309 domain-containing protein n=1 Tax=Novosphingobium ginsenosidimutans TaxID=1176536 RepID=UPI001EE347BC|nr:DUF2309 domain-containing protein [Novosphingobium ginsenosidimutans]
MTAQFSAAAFEPIAVTTAIREAIDHAVRQVPPAWPLASSVAVNPFLGQTARRLPTPLRGSARLAACR